MLELVINAASQATPLNPEPNHAAARRANSVTANVASRAISSAAVEMARRPAGRGRKERIEEAKKKGAKERKLRAEAMVNGSASQRRRES